ncbi:MAG: hypothetical protein V4474_03900 [Patescibacteria group bacterium]
MKGFTIVPLLLIGLALALVGAETWYLRTASPQQRAPSFSDTSVTTPPAGGVATVAPYHSGIRGSVMAGPTCPVERTPPDPACADKPLSTTVAVFRAGNPVNPYAITKSAADGTFEFSLPPGNYVVGAGEGMLPRCAQTPATVQPSGYTDIVVSCDTGIR